MLGILASRADDASVAIARELLRLAADEAVDGRLDDRYRLDGAELVVVDALHIELTAVDERFEVDPSWIAVVSRHAGETGPLLTAHFPGNIDEADFGGDPRSVPPACPRALGAYLEAVDARAPDGYDVAIECTHHGPTDCGVPIMFVEVGSGPAQWSDPAPIAAVADALWSVRTTPSQGERQVVGLGGGHYAPRFERVLRETDWGVGHIAPDWALEALGDDDLDRILPGLFEASGAAAALLDGDRPDLAAAVDRAGYRVVSERYLRAVSSLGAAVVEALEADMVPVDDGLAVGDRRADSPAALRFVAVPTEFVAACAAVDATATEAAIRRRSVAYALDAESTPDGRMAVIDQADASAVVDALVDVLAEKYDRVERTDGAVVATRRQFDPAAARELGVPEGPQFGRLSAGEPVTIDGREVTPGDVTVERSVTFALPSDV